MIYSWKIYMRKRRKMVIDVEPFYVRRILYPESTETSNERLDTTKIPCVLWPWPNFILASTHISVMTHYYSDFFKQSLSPTDESALFQLLANTSLCVPSFSFFKICTIITGKGKVF
jgi:hypothetical protein